jgi:hypothetical protein
MRRCVLPAVLLAIGLFLLAGCFWVPLPEKPVLRGQPNVAKMVGPAKSKNAVHLGVTREQVEQAIGRPQRWRIDGTATAYTFTVRNGAWIYPMCFMGLDTWKDYAVRLDYGPDGRLTSYQVVSARGGGQGFMGPSGPWWGSVNLLDQVLPPEGTETSVGPAYVTTRPAARMNPGRTGEVSPWRYDRVNDAAPGSDRR